MWLFFCSFDFALSVIVICTLKKYQKLKEINVYLPDQDNTSLFVAIAVPLLLIFILFMTLLFLRRRRFLCKRTTDARVNDNMSLPDSTMDTSRPVLIKNFAEHYRMMSADSDFR